MDAALCKAIEKFLSRPFTKPNYQHLLYVAPAGMKISEIIRAVREVDGRRRATLSARSDLAAIMTDEVASECRCH